LIVIIAGIMTPSPPTSKHTWWKSLFFLHVS